MRRRRRYKLESPWCIFDYLGTIHSREFGLGAHVDPMFQKVDALERLSREAIDREAHRDHRR